MARRTVVEDGIIFGNAATPADNTACAGQSKPHYYRQGSTTEWYTPLPFVEAARRTMGTIDLDPATNDGNHANAKLFFTKSTNGLDKTWNGNVWLNPPFGRGLAAWMRKMNEEFVSGRATQITCLIPVRTNAGWFQALGGGAGVSFCFPRPIKFIDGETMEQSKTAAMMPNVVVYVGSNHKEFAEEFRQFGMVARVATNRATWVKSPAQTQSEDDTTEITNEVLEVLDEHRVPPPKALAILERAIVSILDQTLGHEATDCYFEATKFLDHLF